MSEASALPQAPPRTTRVLLVEDDPGFQLLIQRILERMEPPAEVEIVDDGIAAFRRLAGASFDLVLLDYSLPGRNGLEVLHDLKVERANVPVVMVTGMGNETVAVDALKLGAHDYLVKSGDLKTALPLVVRRVIEKIRLEDGLRRFHEENSRLRELDRLKSQFIANVSHELRTPLVSIAGYTDMLLTDHLGPLTAEQRRALTVCSRNADRLKVLIDNILNLSSLDAHKVRPSSRAMDLAALVRHRALALEPSCIEKQLSLHVDAPGELWARGDPDLVEQVVWNLLGNAVKFTPNGGRVDVRCHPDPSGLEAVVSVEDSGCGIDERDLPRIFDRFWQADGGPTRRYGGLGIGLSIVKEILDAHQTAIHVTSSVGKGSTFSFCLPVATEQAPRERPENGVPPSSHGRTVLVVDDEADTREFVKAALEMAGHRVVLASGGRDVLQVLRTSRVDVILLDVAMSDRSGLDVLGDLKRDERTAPIPVLMLTAIVDQAMRDRGMQLGASSFVDKPIRTSTLLQQIDRSLRS